MIEPKTDAVGAVSEMVNGNKPADGGGLILDFDEAATLVSENEDARGFVRRFVGSADSIQGYQRFCLWIQDKEITSARRIKAISERIDNVRAFREKSTKELTKKGCLTPHAFQEIRQTGSESAIVIPRHSSAARSYLPISLWPQGTIVADGAFALYDAPLWNFALLASRIHLVWIAAVCGKIKTDYRYSSTLGWNTFPVPALTEKNKADLTHWAQEILLARESHFPASIADLYEPDAMPDALLHAHEQNDEVLERIYIGRRFKNDSERLEKLFDLYTKMTASEPESDLKPSRPGKANKRTIKKEAHA